MESNNKLPVNKQRRINRICAEIIEARNRWERLIHENCILRRTAKGPSDRSPLKILYIVLEGEWLNEVRDDILRWSKKLDRTENSTLKTQRRAVWLPEVIENAEEIRLTAYAAERRKRVTLGEAREYAKRNGDKIIAAINLRDERARASYEIRYKTGKKYRLRVTDWSGKKHLRSFPAWSVCICSDLDSVPALRRDKGFNSVPDKVEFPGAIARGEKSGLFKLHDHVSEVTEEVDDDDLEWS